MKLALDIIRQQIANLLLVHPELKDDEESLALSLESETEAIDLFRQIERQRQEDSCLAGAIASNIAELQLRQERIVRREKARRELMLKLMQAAGLPRLEMPEATLSISKGRERVIILDDASVPSSFRHEPQTPKPDLKKIGDALKTGMIVNWAATETGQPSISIRTK